MKEDFRQDNLAPTELTLSDETDWLVSGIIMDNMRWYFQEFNDSIPNPPRMNSKIWFYRRTKASCPICLDFYRPHLDRQRFCHGCEQWFHLGCLGDESEDGVDFEVSPNQGDLDIVAVGEDGSPAVFDEVLGGPTVRGHGGVYIWENNWLNTGSGVQKGLIQGWRVAGRVPDDWESLLGENFLGDFLVGKTWKSFHCPSCGGVV